MARLPARLTFTVAGVRFAVVHGGVEQINRFLFPGSPAAELGAELEAAGTDAVVAGHSGLPFTRRVDGRLWHNPGALGLPANDGTTDVWYSLIEAEGDGLAIRHRRLAYDHDGAAAAIRRAGLPDAYARALLTGRWPETDILPDEDAARSGRPIRLADLAFTRSGAGNIACGGIG
jgi:diadenosine tetraphosphatase ApaH/serine/threonine PP2A family protein phosphatase